MLWKGRRRSTNVEDLRGAGGSSGGGGRSLPGRGGVKLGLGTIILLAIIGYFFGINPAQLLQVVEQAQAPGSHEPAPQAPSSPGALPQDEPAAFASVVLADTEEVWTSLMTGMQRTYEPPTLKIFRDGVDSACGYSSSAVGPFYCPGDRDVYIDLGFFDELDQRFGAPGDFAQAYVIAHEVGHHVQNLAGISSEVSRLQARSDREESNALSVNLELQADCFAGIWAHHAQKRWQILEAGDVEEGLGAAAAIGDDRLQREAGRRVQPESWTHGSSAQRVQWFKRGLETGEVGACDTFGAGG